MLTEIFPKKLKKKFLNLFLIEKKRNLNLQNDLYLQLLKKPSNTAKKKLLQPLTEV